MRIAIIGAGNVGTTLGAAWAKEGHQIVFGVRNPEDSKWGELKAQQPQAAIATNQEAARAADAIVLSTPWDATEAAVRACGDLSGKLLIDATNPIKADFTGLDRGFDTSGAEQVAQWAKGAHVFKAMNQIGSVLMDHPSFPSGAKPVMFVAGDGPQKQTVLDLVGSIGFEAIDVGGLEKARLLEPLAWLWIHLALVQGLGRDFGFALLRK